MLPLKKNIVIVKWIGPFEVIEKIGELDYRLKLDDGKMKTYHMSILKHYVNRERAEIILMESHAVANDGKIEVEAKNETKMKYNDHFIG